MTIPVVQQGAFLGSPDFMRALDGVVRTEAAYRLAQGPPAEPATAQDTANYQYAIAIAKGQAQSSPFAPAIVADTGWVLTFDQWASAPDQSALLGQVQKYWPVFAA